MATVTACHVVGSADAVRLIFNKIVDFLACLYIKNLAVVFISKAYCRDEAGENKAFNLG